MLSIRAALSMLFYASVSLYIARKFLAFSLSSSFLR